MWFILGDSAGKQKFTSFGVEPNTNSTRRAGLLAAVAGPVGLIVGVRTLKKMPKPRLRPSRLLRRRECRM
jgi:hypothetical protein